ncbi:MAG: lipid II flippase MurJ [Patescibacteria group bacterium]
MVKNLLNIFNREIAGLHEAAYLLGFFALCSQILALWRDRMLASHFGAGTTLDLYYSAFRIPDILFVTLASIVSISVLIPLIIERLDKGKPEAKEFINNVFSFFFFAIGFSAVLAFIFTPQLMALIFPNFAVLPTFGELVSLTRVLLLSPIFLGFSNLLASITQVYKRFFVYAMSPVVYNVGIIIGIIFFYPIWGLTGLGFGVILGAFFHFAIQAPFVASEKMLPSIRFYIKWKDIKNIIFISLPRTITVSSVEITKLFMVSFASFFIPGSVSVFNFSLNLQSVPLSIIGVSYSIAAFPTLSRIFSTGNKQQFLEQMVSSVRHIVFWSIPVTVLFIVLRAQIVRTILGAGGFNWDATRLTAAALALFVVSLIAQNLITLFIRSYYSQGRTKTPLFMNLFSAIVTIVTTYYLVMLFNSNEFFRSFWESLLKVTDLEGTVVLMLPLGFSIGALFNLCIHWFAFEKDFKNFSGLLFKTFFHTFSSSIIMGFVAYKFLDVFDNVFNVDTLLGIFLQGFLSGVMGIISAIIVLYLLKNRELMEVWKALHKKIWKAKVVVPGSDPQ